MRKLMLLALAISTSAIVSGCAATTGNFCDLADPHRPSPDKRQAMDREAQRERHQAVRVAALIDEKG